VHGFFGKIPSHGDFITRNLPRGFLDKWDDWLQSGIAESKAQLGDGWLDIYLTCPVWRFAIKGGICGGAWAGIMMPSVDRVGRYFPLTIATPLDPATVPFAVPGAGAAWFDQVTGLALRTLDDDHFEANGLQSALDVVADIPLPPDPVETLATAADAWSLVVLSRPGGDISASMADALVTERVGPYSLWWTEGDEGVRMSSLVVGGLPDVRGFAELLHGTWDDLASAAGDTATLVSGLEAS